MRIKPILLISTGILSLLVALGYWYSFIAGAPQLDASQVTKSKDLSFRVETFHSAAMGTTRTYGLILPPGYHQHPEKRYPVIFQLMHNDSSFLFPPLH